MNLANSPKSVYVLSTGGTISMQKTASGYAPNPGYLAKAMELIPELKNPDMPHYTIYEYSAPIDSANMRLEDWAEIGRHIQQNYEQYDGFVILHGTDTMAYTASALSFMLENLAKPIILTGSQLPLFETRSDARANLINALWMAGNYHISEVCIYFNHKLFRGNRCRKINSNNFNAFASPNYPVLAKVGTSIDLYHELGRETCSGELRLQLLKPTMISTLRLFPGLADEILQSCLKIPLQALVLESYGAGTAPQNADFIAAIQNAIRNGVVIVNCSQCLSAKVSMSDYSASSALVQAGVISGGDMTVEATIAKLFYLFSKQLSLTDIKTQLITNLRGELTI